MATWMTIRECAEYMRLTERAVYHMVYRNQIPYHKLGKRLRFKKEEVDADLERGRVLTERDIQLLVKHL